MPTFSNFHADGLPKWGGKRNLTANNTTPDEAPVTVSNVISGLAGVDIKTNIQNVSIKIVKSGNTVGHFDLEQISSWDLSGNQIILNSSDEIPVTLVFINTDEAIIGDQRLTSAQNGGILS